MNSFFCSICIPSYNRPNELRRLLESVDSVKYADNLEIVICEDNAPKRKEVREQVEEYKKVSKYKVTYIENEVNLGYDKNLRNIINKSQGEFIIFMGDDDMFMPQALDHFLDFIELHKDCGYILRSYRANYTDGSYQDFRYYSTDKTFPPSEQSYIEMFDKSVFISGFTIRRDCAKQFETDNFDGSLLYQMYLLAEVCRVYPSAYSRILISQSIEGGIPFFGNSESEKPLYTPGTITVSNSVNFMRWFTTIVDYISEKYHTDSNIIIKQNMSKYSYSFMAIQRNKGLRVFKEYVHELKKMGFGSSVYFYVYYYSLMVLGKNNCDRIVRFLKKMIGHRPQL